MSDRHVWKLTEREIWLYNGFVYDVDVVGTVTREEAEQALQYVRDQIVEEDHREKRVWSTWEWLRHKERKLEEYIKGFED